VRERLQARIDELDQWLTEHACAVAPADRDQAWHDAMDEALKRRSVLMTQRDLGFMITDRRRVRG
jgi:hypothetical protein